MKAIHLKILKIQNEEIKIIKDASNPFFKSKYATLGEVLSKLMPAVSAEGLTITQSPRENGLETEIFDTESGESVKSFVPYIGISDMQKLGGAITYARRYALIAMFCLDTEDDDGNMAVSPAKAKVAERVKAQTTLEQKLKLIDSMPENLMKKMLTGLPDRADIRQEDKEIISDYINSKLSETININ